MNCSKIQKSLSAYHDDQLTPELRTELSTHLEGCSLCAEELEDFRRLTVLSAQLDDPQPPSDLLWTRLERELDRAEPSVTLAPLSTVRRSSTVRRFPIRLAAIAAVLMVGAGIGLVMLQMQSKPLYHDVAAMNRYLDHFLHSPDEAQRIFLAHHKAEEVDLGKPAQLAGYQTILASHLPEGYSLHALHVFDMVLCICDEIPCVCEHPPHLCAHATYKGNGSQTLVVFQHPIDQPNWFRDRPTSNRLCNGKPTRIVQLDDTRLAATWPVDGTFVTLIGARDIDEVTQFITHLGG